MKVTKRDGSLQDVHFDKITTRILRLSSDLRVDPTLVAQQTIKALCNLITTSELDTIAANCAETMVFLHGDYGTLASRLTISNNHKSTPGKFTECCKLQRKYDWLLDEQAWEFIIANGAELDKMIVESRDYLFSFASFKTLQQGYLKTDEQPPWITTRTGKPFVKGSVIDRPQYMYLRNAIAKWRQVIPVETALRLIKEDYNALSLHKFTHGTPALMNACESGFLASCFLWGCPDDTRGIGDFNTMMILISKSGGGIGAFVHDVRPAGSRIKTSRGVSSGICPQLVSRNQELKTFDQGGGKRKGSGAFYIELWNADVCNVFQMKRSTGGAYRAQELFFAAWIPDLFMVRLLSGQPWSLMGSDTAPGLSHVYDGMEVCALCRYCYNPSYAKYIELPKADHLVCNHAEWDTVDAFTILYTKYEACNLARQTVKPITMVHAINEVRRETGTPYICFKDHVNRQSNQKNIGTIQSSNLCTEIVQWSTFNSIATCILASINLTICVKMNASNQPEVDYDAVYEATRRAVKDCDRMVDANKYPVDECIKNAKDTRAIGVGCQGLANLFAICGHAWDSQQAEQIDMMIHETMYYAALCETIDLAKQHGPYPLFAGSPASRGQLRFDLWTETQRRMKHADCTPPLSGRYDFDVIRKEIQLHGMRNSLLVALMPTQSTSLILGNNECFEPFFSMCFSRGVLGGERPEFNRHLAADCIQRGIWTESLRAEIINAGGITSKVASLPLDLKTKYKVWIDIPQLTIVKRAGRRAAFVDQSQSLNLLFANNSDIVLQSSMVEAWKQGLPTGCYYTRTTAVTEALKTGVSTIAEGNTNIASVPTFVASVPMCRLINGKPAEDCTSCSS